MNNNGARAKTKPTYEQLAADYKSVKAELKRVDNYYINDICQQAWAYEAEIAELKQALAAANQLNKAAAFILN